MKSIKFAAEIPAFFMLVADDLTELHASHILLLLKYCSINGKIVGASKLAKLDCCVRYPDLFD